MPLLSTGVVVGQHHSLAIFGDKVGPINLKFELGLDFLTMHPPTMCHRPTFNRSEVIVLTNKETNPQTKTQRHSADNIHPHRYPTPVEKERHRPFIETKNSNAVHSVK